MKLSSFYCAAIFNRRSGLLLFLAWSALASSPGQAQTPADPNNCGTLANHYGPFDYRTQKEPLKIVEGTHFKPHIEALISGNGTGYVGGDIAYTLHTSPNHHRALMALTKLSERMKTPQPPGLRRPVACYFDRAVRFAPNDTVVRVLFARFLAQQGQSQAALAQLAAAVRYAQDSTLSHYNIGLAYLELGQFEQARTQAHRAAALGLERPELEQRLRAAGQWQDAPG